MQIKTHSVKINFVKKAVPGTMKTSIIMEKTERIKIIIEIKFKMTMVQHQSTLCSIGSHPNREQC